MCTSGLLFWKLPHLHLGEFDKVVTFRQINYRKKGLLCYKVIVPFFLV